MSNAETYALRSVHQNTKSLLSSIKQLFGARWMDGYHEMSLKGVLNDILRKPRSAVFKTDKGSRYGTTAHNCRALVLFKSEVEVALKSARKNEPHAKNLQKALETNWVELGITCATFALVYYLIFAPFHSAVSKTVPWVEVKNAILLTQEKLEELANQDLTTPKDSKNEKDFKVDLNSKPFSTFKSAILREETSESTQKLWTTAVDLYEGTTKKQVAFLKKLTSDMANSVLVKFKKDTKGLLEATIDDNEILPWTNRRSESSFAHLKKVMQRNKNLGDEKFPELGQAAMNRVGDWLREKVFITRKQTVLG